MAGSSSPPRCARAGLTASDIVLIGDEPHLPYQRPPLSKDYLDGKTGLDLLQMRPETFFVENRIELVSGVAANEIDRAGGARSSGSGTASASPTTTSCWRPARATACRRYPASSSTASATCAPWPRPRR